MGWQCMERNLIVITLQTMFQADFISALGHDLPEDGIWCVLSAHVCGLLVSGPTHPLVPRPSPLLTRCHMVINWATDA